jgi:hypothetical protein
MKVHKACSREMIDFGERVPVDTLGSRGVKRK